ncbi:MAG: hypothetical protein NT088_02975 [Candidatus Omnitrophica bacterium]|nr:hypothetical protein [Candidatus Omnitrophota bacterium]
MSDVNERVVQRYFELKGYMVTTNLKYMIRKKSSGESDIDLAIFRVKPLDRAIVEVKGWHTETFSAAYFKIDNPDDYRARILNFVRPEALMVAEEFFHTKDFRKILVVPELSPKQRNEITKMLKEKYGIDILEFTTVLEEVIAATKINKNYRDSEFQQTIRLLKAYEFIK